MQDPLKYIYFFLRELKTSCLLGNFPPKRLHFSQRRPTKGRDLSRGRKKNDSVQKTLAGIPAQGGGEASARWAVTHTHLQPRLDGAVPLRLSAAVVPEPLQVFGAVKHPRSPFQSSSPGQLLRLFHLRPLFLWGQSQGLRSTAKPLLAGRKGPRGREQETGRQRTSKHTPMGPAGRHGGERDPPGMAPMIPQQKGAPRSSGHHPAGVTPHDKDGSPQGFHLPDKAQGTRKKGLGGGELGVRPSPPGHPVTSGARALLVLRRRAHGRCQLQGRGAGLRAEEGGGRFLSAPRGLVGMFGARQQGGGVRGNRSPPRSRGSWFGGVPGWGWGDPNGDGVTPVGMG